VGVTLRGRAIGIAKVAASFGFLAWLIARVEPAKLWTTFSAMRPLPLALFVLVVALTAVLRVESWRIVLRARGVRARLGAIADAFFTGYFYGTFIPSSLGADAARAVALTRVGAVPLAEATASVVAVNVAGLVALALLVASAGIALQLGGLGDAVTAFAVAGAIGGLGTVALIFAGVKPGPMLRLRLGAAAYRRIRDTLAALREYLPRPVLWRLLAACGGIQLLLVLTHYTASLALGLDIPFWAFGAVAPLAIVARMLPLSVSGLGLQQGIYVALFLRLGVPAAEALAVSLLVASSILATALVCGVLHACAVLARALRPRMAERADPEPEAS
jgi:uncharacterized membrane protein YbhN (UPF0104 family)